MTTNFAARVSGEANFQNKLAVITGGSGGIGISVAKAILERGGKVALVDLRESKDSQALVEQYGADRVAFVRNDVSIANPEEKQVRKYAMTVKSARLLEQVAALKATGVGDDDVRVKALNADLERTQATLRDMPPSVEEAMQAILKLPVANGTGGKVDFLVNNAGIQIQKPFEKQTPDDFNTLMGINYFGKVNWARAVVPNMREGGKIINTSSVHGHVGSPERAPYTSAMHATLGLTKTLAGELAGRNISVFSISPAFIETDLAWNPLHDKVKAGDFTLEGEGKPEMVDGKPNEAYAVALKRAEAWRLQLQGGKWVQMDDVVAAYVGLMDGSRKLETGGDLHGPELTVGYIDESRKRAGPAGIAMFDKPMQEAVDHLNRQLTAPQALQTPAI